MWDLTHSPTCLPPLPHPVFEQYKTYKVVYRRYAGLYFIFCVDATDNELLYLETIHLFVEVVAGHGVGGKERGPMFEQYALARWPLLLLHFEAASMPPRASCHPQILDHYFGNVCELDLVFGFHKVGRRVRLYPPSEHGGNTISGCGLPLRVGCCCRNRKLSLPVAAPFSYRTLACLSVPQACCI